MPVNALSAARRRPLARRGRAGLRGEVAGVFRRAILDAAERVFEARGYSGAKMAAIAREAGLAAGTLYNYFANKEQIFRALVELRGEDFVKRLEEAAAAPGAPPQVLVGLVQAAFQYLEAHGSTFALAVQSGAMAEASMRRLCGASAERRCLKFLKIFEQAIGRAIGADAR